MSASAVPAERRVLADVLGRSVARDVGLVVAVAALTALAAQVRVPVPGSPVPITGQTFAVLLGAAAVGPVRGAVAQLLYIVVGVLGVPVFTGGESGLAVMGGATGGYIVGFVLASVVVGLLARRGADRRPLGAATAFVVGSAVIYAVGVPWLMAATGMGVAAAVDAGVVPFVLGDVLKAVLAGALLPGAWRLVDHD